MGEWKKYAIGDLCQTISDTFKSQASEVVLINTSDVLEGKCLNHDKVRNINLKGQFKKTFQKDDILYSEIRPANKRYAYIDFEAKNYIASTKLMVLRHNELINPKFLFYILQSNDMITQLQMLAESRSGTFPQITFDVLSKEVILLPSLNEQEKIIKILSSFDDKIEVNRKINENLEQQAQALFKSWFVDFEPFKDGKFVESELGMIPEGWKVGKLNDYVEVKDGTHDSPKPCSEGHPLITSKFINPYSVDRANANKISDKDFVKINERSLVEFGDILMSMIGTVGLISYVCDNEIDYAIKNVALFKTSNVALFRYYLLKYLKTKNIKDYIDIHLAGSTQKYISLTELRNIPLIVPTDEVLSKYNKLISPIIEGIIEKEREISSLSALRDTLLPRLMSGEINLSD